MDVSRFANKCRFVPPWMATLLTVSVVVRGINVAVPWLRSLVAGLSPRRPGFAPGSIHVGFVVDRVALGQVFLRVLRFSPVNISFHSRSPNPYHLGNAWYANVSRHPRLGTRSTPSSGVKRKRTTAEYADIHCMCDGSNSWRLSKTSEPLNTALFSDRHARGCGNRGNCSAWRPVAMEGRVPDPVQPSRRCSKDG
jgi:hypothetical protein